MGIFDLFKPNVEKMKEKGNVKGLIKVLQYNEDSIMQGKAAEALGEIEDESVVNPLIQALEDEELIVQEAAESSLIKLGKLSIEPLFQSLKKGNLNEEKITKILAKIGKPALESLVQSLGNEDKLFKEKVLRIIKLMDERATELIIQILKEGDRDARWGAAHILGTVGDAIVIEPLKQALNDEDWDVKMEAVLSLSLLGWNPTSKFEKLFFHLIGGRPSPTPEELKGIVKEDLIYHIWDINNPPSIDEVLVEIGKENLLEFCIQAASEGKHAHLKANAITCLTLLKDERAIKPLISLLSYQNDLVKMYAIEALVKFEESVVKPLLEFLKTPEAYLFYHEGKYYQGSSVPWDMVPWDNSIRFDDEFIKRGIVKNHGSHPFIAHSGFTYIAPIGEIIETLTRIGEPAVKELVHYLKDSSPVTQCIAAEALAKMDNVEALIPALKDSECDIRFNVAVTFGKCKKSSKVIEVLKDKIEEEDLAVIAGAYRFFLRLGKLGTEELLINALNEEQYGCKILAEDFLNCGNSKLENAARKWATEHGFTIVKNHVYGGPKWGEGVES